MTTSSISSQYDDYIWYKTTALIFKFDHVVAMSSTWSQYTTIDE